MQLADGKTGHAAHVRPKVPFAFEIGQSHLSSTLMAGWHRSDELCHLHNVFEQSQQPCRATVPRMHFSVQAVASAITNLAGLGVPQLDALVVAGAEEAAPIIAEIDVLDTLQSEHSDALPEDLTHCFDWGLTCFDLQTPGLYR